MIIQPSRNFKRSKTGLLDWFPEYLSKQNWEREDSYPILMQVLSAAAYRGFDKNNVERMVSQYLDTHTSVKKTEDEINRYANDAYDYVKEVKKERNSK